MVWGQVKRENSSLPVAVRVSKMRVLKLPIAHLPTPTKPFSKRKKPFKNLYRSIKVIAHDFCVIREVKVAEHSFQEPMPNSP